MHDNADMKHTPKHTIKAAIFCLTGCWLDEAVMNFWHKHTLIFSTALEQEKRAGAQHSLDKLLKSF